MAVLALALFGVLFGVVFVLRTVIQKRATGDNGIRAGVLGASAGSLEWFAGWLLVLALAAGVVAPIAELAGLDPLTTNPGVHWTGMAVAVIGIGLAFLAQVDMGDEWRIGIDTTERTGLVDDGAFGVVRNPVFTALVIAAVGLAMMVPNPISIIGVITLIVAVELQVRFVEEPHLRGLHGDEYDVYASEVGRFVPGIGRF